MTSFKKLIAWFEFTRAWKIITQRNLAILIVGALLSAASYSIAQQRGALAMSPQVQDLFRAEMRELLSGTQTIAASLPVGDWDNIVRTSAKMKESYVLEKKLTKTQKEEIERLPKEFLVLDEEFHARADELRRAAAMHDSQATSRQFLQLLNACVACHSTFASSRFPGLSHQSATKNRK